jgi:hypothetical protein
MNNPITPEQLKKLHVLFRQTGIEEDDRRWMISLYSNHRTQSSRDLYLGEASRLIRDLLAQNPQLVAADKMRKKILSMAHDLGWELEGSRHITARGNPQGAVDMERINNWCVKYGHGHKALDAYTYEELPRLVSQFEAMYTGVLKRV